MATFPPLEIDYNQRLTSDEKRVPVVERYWRNQPGGHRVRIKLEPMRMKAAGDITRNITVLRSNLVNGLPPAPAPGEKE